jgi:hypothetical protein
MDRWTWVKRNVPDAHLQRHKKRVYQQKDCGKEYVKKFDM